jgi:hypothetical protein
MITHEEIIELGKVYGFSKEILGYSDVEKQLISMALKLYVLGFNDGVRQERELDFLEYFADETGLPC